MTAIEKIKAFDHQVFVNVSDIKSDFCHDKGGICLCGMKWCVQLKDITQHTCPLNSNMKLWAFHKGRNILYYGSFFDIFHSHLSCCKVVHPFDSISFYGYLGTELRSEDQSYDEKITIGIQYSMEVIAKIIGEKAWPSF